MLFELRRLQIAFLLRRRATWQSDGKGSSELLIDPLAMVTVVTERLNAGANFITVNVESSHIRSWLYMQ